MISLSHKQKNFILILVVYTFLDRFGKKTRNPNCASIPSLCCICWKFPILKCAFLIRGEETFGKIYMQKKILPKNMCPMTYTNQSEQNLLTTSNKLTHERFQSIRRYTAIAIWLLYSSFNW